jgi:non-specific serine/threonine protein kinase/serine/threonine-protein kinase
MSSERWERTKQVLEEALHLASERRLAYLDSACGTDRELRAEVESLIASHEQAGSQFLAVPAPELLLSSSQNPPKAPVNRIIGRYQLVEELGRGGMGQVWLAEQVAPVRRQVALKLIKGGMFDTPAMQRFQSERQSLAIMDHPSIAKVFDAGATPDGQPYFVMEYVPGLPITDYCDQKKLRIHQRLDLFIKVCEGVQHAHQKAIIHRDLKPANILIVEVDGKPMPRIIDFGLAKTTTPQVAGDALFTQIGSFLGTPGYMSPEQADPDVQDVDTRTDVYSLGVVLYVLLTGFLPFDSKSRQKQPLHELLRQVREEDPPRPSTKVGLKKQPSTAMAEMRGTAPNQLVSLLRGDLDWITMKALEKDRERRYGTPTELAADIHHFLRNEPVMARPASTGYRLQKYVRRHRLGVSAAAAIATLVVAFALVQALQLRRITRERDRADRITEFTTGIFKVSDPSERVGRAVTAGELLDKASKDIDTGLAKDPELQTRMMKVMGTAYSNLGLHQRAQSLFERSIQIGSSAMGPENPETLSAMKLLAWSLFQQGQLVEAERLQRRVLDIQRRVLGPENRDTLDSMGDLAMIVGEAGNLSEAEKLNREELEKKKHLLGPEASDTLVSMDNLATVLAREGRLAEAEALEQETLEIQLRVFGGENLRAISSMINLAGIQMDEGRYEEAEKGFRQALDLEKSMLGADQPETALTMYNLACILAQRGQSDEALSLLRQAVDHGLHPRIDLKIERESKFNSLHGDPRFAALVTHAKQRAAAAQKPN